MLVKEISRNLLSNTAEVDRLIETGYQLVVKEKNRIVFTINPPINTKEQAVEEDLSYLLKDPTLFTKINETNYNPFDYSSVQKPNKPRKANKKQVVDAMHLLDEYLIPLTEEETQNDYVNQSIPKQYDQVPAVKLGFNLTYRQH